MQHRIPQRVDDFPDPLGAQFKQFADFEIGVRQCKPSTTKDSFSVVSRFMEWLYAERDVTDLATVTANHYLEFMASQSWTKPTAKRNRAYLKMLLTYQVVSRLIDPGEVVMFDSMKMTRTYKKPPPKAYTDAEIAEVYRRIDTRYPYDPYAVDKMRRGLLHSRTAVAQSMMNVQLNALVTLLLETGARLDEAWKLDTDDVDIINTEVVLCGKFDKIRAVPYSERAKLEIRKWVAHRNLIVVKDHDRLWVKVWPADRGEPVSRKQMDEWIFTFTGVNRKAGKLEKEVDANWHKFRKTYATRSYEEGMPIEVVSRMLGHNDIATTMKYLGVNEAKVMAKAREFEKGRAASYDKAKAS